MPYNNNKKKSNIQFLHFDPFWTNLAHFREIWKLKTFWQNMIKVPRFKANVCKKRENFNIRPVLSFPDSLGTCPEVPQGQARPDLSPNFRFFRISRVSPGPETWLSVYKVQKFLRFWTLKFTQLCFKLKLLWITIVF